MQSKSRGDKYGGAFGRLNMGSDPAGGTVPCSGSSFSACLVVEDCVVVAPGKGERLGTRESWKGLKEKKGEGRACYPFLLRVFVLRT